MICFSTWKILERVSRYFQEGSRKKGRIRGQNQEQKEMRKSLRRTNILLIKNIIMEYTEMVDKVKALAAQNRAAKTKEDKAEVRRQMDALKESDPKAFAVAVGYMAKTTEQKVKELTMAEQFGDITDMVSMAYIAKTVLDKVSALLR